MNYQKIYNQLIEKRQNERLTKKDCYVEKHHIIPRCMGGNNDKENLVNLTAKEHFIAHFLLYKIYRNSQMAFALFSMTRGKNNKGMKTYFNSNSYSIAREIFIKNNQGKNNPRFGKKLSEEHKRILIESNKNRKRELGQKRSEETKRLISEKAKGRIMSEETKIKLSKIKSGNKLTQEHKDKISLGLTGRIMSNETRLKQSIKANMPNARIKKPVVQYDLNLNIIKFFDGTGIASRELNICKTAIGRVCKNKAKIAGGFIFKYA